MQSTGTRLIKYGGKASLASLPSKFKDTVEAASKSLEAKYQYPKITEAKIQGSIPHKSAKDPSDDKDVVTVSYHTDSGTRITSIHAHDDSTWNEYPSRNAGKGK
ncbi:hypothetical protein E8E12_000844 [Didymella heteroderae]|uniref:Uncharacterized protein n=1 Tax=Didymella heteroderae TaxID=1769908 RepID=A0A9P4WFK1_9PLEO|nr:hypothetical protein E8E12_000844 [Didymella heteroderae]